MKFTIFQLICCLLILIFLFFHVLLVRKAIIINLYNLFTPFHILNLVLESTESEYTCLKRAIIYLTKVQYQITFCTKWSYSKLDRNVADYIDPSNLILDSTENE